MENEKRIVVSAGEEDIPTIQLTVENGEFSVSFRAWYAGILS